MVADAETIEQVRSVTEQKYKYGFVTDIETDTAPKGLNEDIVRFISAKKGEPEWLLEWRLKAFRLWLTQEEPNWAKVDYPPIDYQDAYYYSAPKSEDDKPKSLDEVDPKLLETYEKLGIPLREQEMLAGVAVDAVFDSVSVATTFKAALEEQGIIFCSISEAVRNHPELVKKYLGSVVPYSDNFFATLNSAVFTDGSFVYRAQGRALPDGAFHLFPHQRGPDRPVRAHPDHRRGRRLCELSGRLHGAHARREPAACRGRRAGRAGRRRRSSIRRCRTGTRATRRARAASTTSSPSAAPAAAATPRFPGPRSRPARPSPGNIRAASCRATTRWASSIPSPSPTTCQQADTGTKMIHLGKNTRSTIISKGISAGRADQTYRGLVRIQPKAENARNYTQCDSAC